MKLYVIGTPIGNLDDISPHFLKTVSELEFLAVEDTRSASRLLKLLSDRHSGFRLWPKKLISFFREKEVKATADIIGLLKRGQAVGLMSEAGMPGVSDPGAYLVSRVRQEGLLIDVVAGPSAVTTALSLSGFEAQVTLFMGFLPKKPKETLAIVRSLAESKGIKTLNLVFLESPYRIRKTVSFFLSELKNSRIFLGRELTKKHQELIWTDTPGFVPESLPERGEYTGVIGIKMI